ncbi:MAG: nitrilase-related carbon-nitrogen hydrolase [Gammaproteobacteria bacterium]|nr:nitrilase-related carbon-nitrogen hydrolase [Gammaproteobacteria bacterium]
MRRGIDVASAAGCDVVLFPELCIPGYLHQDLIYHPEYVDRNLDVLASLKEYSRRCHPDLHIVVGDIDRNRGPGKPFLNCAAVLRSGDMPGRYTKQLLPFYDVFDELRYYEPGKDLLLLDIAGESTGITICEDLWNDKASDDYNYADNPFHQYREAGASVVLSLNSSPYVQDKTWQRMKVIAPGTEDGMTVVYVNQWGGQDELVFDGQSFAGQERPPGAPDGGDRRRYLRCRRHECRAAARTSVATGATCCSPGDGRVAVPLARRGPTRLRGEVGFLRNGARVERWCGQCGRLSAGLRCDGGQPCSRDPHALDLLQPAFERRCRQLASQHGMLGLRGRDQSQVIGQHAQRALPDSRTRRESRGQRRQGESLW